MNSLEISSYLFRDLREFPGDLTCMCGSANLYNFASVTWVPMLNTTRGTEKTPGTIQLLRALNMLYLEWWETISNTFFLCTCSCKQKSFTTGALGRSCLLLEPAGWKSSHLGGLLCGDWQLELPGEQAWDDGYRVSQYIHPLRPSDAYMHQSINHHWFR